MDPLDNPMYSSPQVAERLAFITEELNDVVKVIRGDRSVPEFDLQPENMDAERPELGNEVDLRFFRLFRFFAVKNITRGTLAGVVYRAGKELGAGFPLVSTKELEQLVGEFKLGALEVVEMGEKHILMELHNSATCHGLPNIGRSVCHFEAGILAGALERIFQRRIDLTETKCCCNGDPHCEFSLARPRQANQPRDVVPVTADEAISQENVQLLTTLATHSIAAIENAALFERTKQLVSIDGLTQIYNHRFFQERLRQELKRARRHDLKLSMVMMDLDNFKQFNDRFGHPQGDQVLKGIAALIKDSLREVDVVARYGGDEFVLVLPHTDADSALLVAERLQEKLRRKHFWGDAEHTEERFSMSIGYATFPDDADSAEELIELADRALLRVKRQGKGDIFRMS